jgi:hypothetical protein
MPKKRGFRLDTVVVSIAFVSRPRFVEHIIQCITNLET